MAASAFRPDPPSPKASADLRTYAALSLKLERLRTRADFLRAQKGVRKSRSGLGLEVCATPEGSAHAGCARAGFTATKKIGNAVIRNRAKRRLRAAAAAVLPLLGREGRDYVLIARPATLTLPFAALKDELANVISSAHAAGESGARAARK
jgi:ribonuclease P protein component